MKLPWWAAPLITAFGLTGCDPDQQLIKDVEGTWQAQTITYQLPAGDSVVSGSSPLAEFKFVKCRWKKEPDNQCGGYYQFAGQNRIYFGYNAVVKSGSKVLTFYVLDMPERRNYPSQEAFLQAQNEFWGGNQPYLAGNWLVVESTDNRLVIEGDAALSRFGEAVGRQARARIEMHK